MYHCGILRVSFRSNLFFCLMMGISAFLVKEMDAARAQLRNTL